MHPFLQHAGAGPTGYACDARANPARRLGLLMQHQSLLVSLLFEISGDAVLPAISESLRHSQSGRDQSAGAICDKPIKPLRRKRIVSDEIMLLKCPGDVEPTLFLAHSWHDVAVRLQRIEIRRLGWS